MPRMSHGSNVTLEAVQATITAINSLNSSLSSPIAFAKPRRLTEFGYMFHDLQVDKDGQPTVEHLLPKGADTVANLIRLGESMRDTSPADDNNSNIPAAYTYLGQFIEKVLEHAAGN